MWVTGYSSPERSTATSRITSTGNRITISALRPQNPAPGAPLLRRIESALTRCPRTPSTAGRSVRAAATETNTTSTPATPMDRMNINGKKSKPESPIRTAVPEKKMERPAVATVRCTASETG